MPRVELKKANNGAKKEKRCGAAICVVRLADDPEQADRIIKPGQRYYTWSFRYGGTRYQHQACGYPKASQLTLSKMSTVLEAVETAETDIAAIDDVDSLPSPEDILGPVAEAAREVAEEYRAAAEAMGSAGEANEERADELDGFADELESFSLSLDDWEANETADPDPKRQEVLEAAEEERRESYLEDFRGELEEALNSCPSF